MRVMRREEENEKMTSAERDEKEEEDESERCFWKSAGAATHNIVILGKKRDLSLIEGTKAISETGELMRENVSLLCV